MSYEGWQNPFLKKYPCHSYLYRGKSYYQDIMTSFKSTNRKYLIILKSASNLNGNLNCSKELEHYAS